MSARAAQIAIDARPQGPSGPLAAEFVLGRSVLGHLIELASELTLSEATVKTHVARILTKLQLRDRVQAVVLAYETGLVSPGAGARPS